MTDNSWNGVRRERLVKNEMAFRDYNNRRVEIEQRALAVDEPLQSDVAPFVCECGNADNSVPMRSRCGGQRVSNTRLARVRETPGIGHYPSMIKTLWASVQGDPVFMRRMNGWLTVAWIIMIPVSFATGWVKSVAYVSALSLWALVSGHWAAWQAARVEVAQKQDEERRAAQDVPEEIVEHLVNETNLSRDPASA